ncbi:uncharacterized protein LOC143031703 isoform X1 [Oratosquilla oratoria]|uniref:uncharacterized protein LOC143031703 isoform X1 n=1 Tax=Oratosquilla oratoria TaxID=337810 RepID=UPI003F76AB83
MDGGGGGVVGRACRLAHSLRHSTDLLLTQRHKLLLDLKTLEEILEAFELILDAEQHTNFHVLAPNHREDPNIAQLQFLYDLFQKVHGLRLCGRDSREELCEGSVSIRCFRGIQELELNYVPVDHLKGLQSLRPSLVSITATRCLHTLTDLFVACGADKASEFQWERLHEAHLSNNPIQNLDVSLALLPHLKVLDLSHCHLGNTDGLDRLPSLAFLNLSHNRLTALPTLAPAASHALTALVINNNFLSHIEGVEALSNLEVLDVSDNVLGDPSGVDTLSSLPHLRNLRLTDNPLTFDINYRIHTIRRLNPATANHEVFLDGEVLNQFEVKEVGRHRPYSRLGRSSVLSSLSLPPSSCITQSHSFHYPYPTPALYLPPAAVASTTGDGEPAAESTQVSSAPAALEEGAVGGDIVASSYKSTGRRKSKKSRTRHIDIADPEDEVTEEMIRSSSQGGQPPCAPPPSLALGENLQPLNSQQVTQALFALHTAPQPPLSSTPVQADRLLDEILQNKSLSPAQPLPAVPLIVAADTKSHADGVVEERAPSGKEEDIEIVENGIERESEVSQTVDERGEGEGGRGKEEEEEKKEEDEEGRGVPVEGTKDDSTEVMSPVLSFYKGSGGHSRRSSLDVSSDRSDSEDEGDVERFLCKRIHEPKEDERDDSEEEEEEDVIVALSSSHLKEKHHITTRTLFKWEMRCLESQELLSTNPSRVVLTFNTSRPAYKSRTYVFEDQEYKVLRSCLAPILEKNTLRLVLPSTMTCLKCDTHFPAQTAKQNQTGGTLCPNCGAGVVVQVEKEPSPEENTGSVEVLRIVEDRRETHEGGPRCSTPMSRGTVPLVQASQQEPADTNSCAGEWSSESVSVCSEASSSVRRESDVEIISNPSVSSIEVLNDHPSGHDTAAGEIQTDVEIPTIDVCTPVTSPATQRRPDLLPATMHESSSSGSMTGSVCTTYEKASAPPTPSKVDIGKQSATNTSISSISALTEEGGSEYFSANTTLEETSGKGVPVPGLSVSPHYLSTSAASIETVKCEAKASSHTDTSSVCTDEVDATKPSVGLGVWVQGLLGTLTGYQWHWWDEVDSAVGLTKSVNPIHYSYEDFRDVDHRLKLFCDVLLFRESDEDLQGLIKAVVVVKDGKEPFVGLVVVSSRNVYVLEVTGPEEECVQSWLKEHLSCPLTSVEKVYSLYQRQGVALQLGTQLVLISLADSHRANCFYNFITECLEDNGMEVCVEECSVAQGEAVLLNLKEHVHLTEETSISHFAMVSLLTEGGSSEAMFLVMTHEDILLFEADLTWYLPPSPLSTLRLAAQQLIANITAIEVHSESHLELLFQDEVTGLESSWRLHVTTSVGACHLLQAIRTPWTELFSVDLQVTCHDVTLAAAYNPQPSAPATAQDLP